MMRYSLALASGLPCARAHGIAAPMAALEGRGQRVEGRGQRVYIKERGYFKRQTLLTQRAHVQRLTIGAKR